MAEVPATPDEQAPAVSSRRLVALLGFAAGVGLLVSLASWCFLQGTHQLQHGIYNSLPRDLGYDGAPKWWSLPCCAAAGLITAFAITRLPGRGGHVPVEGLNVTPTQPIDLPGVVLAATATLGLGIVLGPEAPLIALGGGLATFAIRQVRRDAPPEIETLIAACGACAALAFIFESPVIGAVVLIEAAALGGAQQRMLVLPGLLAAGVGSLVSIGMGSWTGLSPSDYALGALQLPQFARPDFVDFVWTVPFGVVVAVVAFAILQLGRRLLKILESREFVVLPLAGLAISGLAIAFSQAADKPVDQVLFSGESAVPGLAANAGTWSVSALALLIVFKGLAWAISLGGFRGGSVFPSLFLGAAGGIMASHLAGFAMTPAVTIGMGAGVVAVLGLPLTAVILAALLSSKSGAGATPLLIVGVVVAHLTAQALSKAADNRTKAATSAAPIADAPAGAAV